jgi:hypothetical protein
MARIIGTDGTVKPVQNLGWLLRNWQAVERMAWSWPTEEARSHDSRAEAVLTAFLKDGRRYETEFCSKTVLWEFCHRPVFYSLPVDFYGLKTYHLATANKYLAWEVFQATAERLKKPGQHGDDYAEAVRLAWLETMQKDMT